MTEYQRQSDNNVSKISLKHICLFLYVWEDTEYFTKCESDGAMGYNRRMSKDQQTVTTEATPFIKWVGGKRSIMPALVSHLPETFNHYYEPFVGGGALFFKLYPKLKQAHLSDTNLHLAITYKVVQQDVEALIEKLKIHKEKHGKAYYYSVRKLGKQRKKDYLQNPVDVAARFIYLNKTCFNGLWRVNSKGDFNVPMGRYKNPPIVRQENLAACHNALQNVEIRWGEFNQIAPQEGDFVYFDPPYHPLDSASFTKYSKQDFTQQDQLELRDFALHLSQRGVKVMLSNSNAPFIQDIYHSSVFNITEVDAPRMVNSNASNRGNVSELLITNY